MTTHDEIAELKAATRAAHETIKDLNETIRRAESLVVELRDLFHVEADEQISHEVTAGMKQLGDVVGKACEDATALVFKRFDEIVDGLTGDDKAGRRSGRPSIPEVIEFMQQGREPFDLPDLEQPVKPPAAYVPPDLPMPVNRAARRRAGKKRAGR